MSAHTGTALFRFQTALFGFLGYTLATVASSPSALADPLLEETVQFTGTVLYIQSKVPGLVIGAVRNGETAIYGFGERIDGGEKPDGDTVLRIGSITKAFTGQVLADLAADGKCLSHKRWSRSPPSSAKVRIPTLHRLDSSTS